MPSSATCVNSESPIGVSILRNVLLRPGAAHIVDQKSLPGKFLRTLDFYSPTRIT